MFFSLLNGAIIGQSFLTMLCRMEWGVYVLFAAMQVLATVFCIFFLPETTGPPLHPCRYFAFCAFQVCSLSCSGSAVWGSGVCRRVKSPTTFQ